MKTWIQATPSSILRVRWLATLLPIVAILLAGIGGGLVALFTLPLAGNELFILLALLGFGPLLLLCVAKFDFMVLVTFCLSSLVRFEPAPVDMLVMLLLPIGLLTGKLSLKALGDSPLIHLILGGYLVANLVSMIYVNVFFEGIRFLFITTYMIILIYFLKMYLTSYQAMRTVMIGYLVSALAAIVMIALGYAGIGADIFLFYYRAVAMFKDANVFGPFLILMILFLVDEILHPHILRGLYLAKVLGIIALAAGVFLSGSRAAWGNLVLSLIIYFMLVVKSRPRIAYLLIVPIVVGALFLPMLSTLLGSQPFLHEFLADRAKFQTYDVSRFHRQLEGIEVGLTHLLGLGPGMWSSAHSLYVRTFAENGIFGFITLISFLLILSMGIFFRAYQETDKPLGISAKVVFASLIGHLMNSIVIDTIHWRHFWFIIGLAWVMTLRQGQALTSDLRGDRGSP